MTEAEEAELRRLAAAAWRRDNGREEHFIASCQGKARFSSPKDAKRSSLYRRAVHGGMQPYHCQFCRHWHIGTVKPGKKPMRIIGDAA